MTAAKKTTPAVPPLSLPERPPSKVEQGLKGERAEPQWIANEREAELNAAIAESTATADELRDKAIAAMVAAGLSQEFAEAAFVLAEDNATAADVAEAVEEVSTAPLCKHGCHGQSWADVPRHLDGVGCEHGSFARKPADEK